MKKLLEYIVANILEKGSSFEVIESQEGDVVTLTIKTEEKDGGLIIGKGGKTIKAIRNVLRIAATLSKKKVFLLVNPQNQN